MALVNITINNKNFQLSCTEGSENQLFVLVDILNAQIKAIKTNNPSASFELILVMTSLFLQNELQSLESKFLADKTSQLEDREQFSENPNKVINYLENLALKLSEYN